MLEKILAQSSRHFTEPMSAVYIYRIADTLEFLHSNGIVHR
jgi:serine/threonine protein kinase